MSEENRLIVVANRLPVRRVEDGIEKGWRTSPGGLVTALAPIVRRKGGAWVGWPGMAGERIEPFEHEGILNVPVEMSSEEVDAFYFGFSNRTLWPLYHDCVRTPEYHRRWWRPYRAVNERFAQMAIETVGQEDAVWVHDYQLQLVPGLIRAKRPDARIGFFLHIPFPPEELFRQLPWRQEILEGLLGSDLVGFQTRLGVHNFVRTAERYAGAERISDDIGPGEHPEQVVLRYEGREIRVQAFPISIDVERFATLAKDSLVEAKVQLLHERLGRERRIMLGVDRLDYTKGIDIRLRAFEELLEQNRLSVEEWVFVQVAVPSRSEVQEYIELRENVERIVGRINGRYGEPGRVPVHYLYRSLPIKELVAYYRSADVMVVTPLRDGMNLVAKEYVASRLDNTGMLVLSEFAGAAQELAEDLESGALLVNPHSIDGMCSALGQAMKMDRAEQEQRMKAMRAKVEERDVFTWAEDFLGVLRS